MQYARTTPVLGALFQITPRWSMYANYGEGFETPTFAELAYRSNGANGFNFALQPATSRHAEVGVKGIIDGNARVNAALFRIDTKNEIVTNSASGGRSDFRNASRTTRDGIELSWQGYLPAGFEASLAYTWLNARFKDAYNAGTPPVLVAAGNALPGVAREVLVGELIWRHQGSGFHAGIEYRASSKIFVNEVNSDAAAGFGVAHFRVGFQQQSDGVTRGNWRISEFIRVDNLSAHRYIGSVIVAEAWARYFEPAPGRSVLVGVNLSVSF